MSTVGVILSTVRDIMMYMGDIKSTVGVFSTVGDIIFCNLSTVGDIMSTMAAVQYRGGTQITKDFPPCY